MRFYIKPTGSTCYDKTGITFPEKLKIDWSSELKQMGATNLQWRHQFEWPNQPKVVTFDWDVNMNAAWAFTSKYRCFILGGIYE